MSSINNPALTAGYQQSFNRLILRYWLTGLVLFLLSGLFGVLIRINQSSPFLNPSQHYSFMTFHGVVMVGFTITYVISVGWLFTLKILKIAKPLARMELVYWLLIAGAVSIIIAVFVGKFAGGFPPMPPLPVLPAGGWPLWASAVFLGGVAIILIATIIFFIEWLVAAHQATGGVGEALGLDILFGRESNPNKLRTSPAVVAITAMSLIGVIAIPIGIYLQANILTRLALPDFRFDPMMAKNTLWMFGHTLANILFWGIFGVVYLLVANYTGREWKVYRLLVAAWLTTMVTTGLTAYLHHVQMDFAVPIQLLLFGEVATYISGIPWAAVSVYGAITRIWRSGVDWQPAMRFIYLGLFSFVIGAIAAYLDATLAFNKVLHNTLWVPSHFHSYMMMGSVLFFFAAVYHFLPELTGKKISSRLPSVHFWMTLVGGLGFLLTFYLAGILSAPRRFADFSALPLPASVEPIIIASIPFAIIYGLGQIIFVYYLAKTLLSKGS